MAEIQVKNGKGEEATVVTVNFEFPSSTNDYVAKYGEEQTLALLHGATTLKIQALVRQKIGTEADPQAAVDAWQPGVRGTVVKKSAFERAQSALSGLTPEQLAELAAKIKAAQKAAASA